MPQIRYVSSGPPPRPRSLAATLLGALAGMVMLGVALLLGVFFVAAAFGVMLIAGLIIYGRLWWLKRRMPSGGDVLEAEYEIVSDSEVGEKRHEHER